jgi:hypothetical protein
MADAAWLVHALFDKLEPRSFLKTSWPRMCEGPTSALRSVSERLADQRTDPTVASPRQRASPH